MSPLISLLGQVLDQLRALLRRPRITEPCDCIYAGGTLLTCREDEICRELARAQGRTLPLRPPVDLDSRRDDQATAVRGI